MTTSVEEQAAEIFARRHLGPWMSEDQTALDERTASCPAFAYAMRRMEQSWQAVGRHAASSEINALREQALTRNAQISSSRTAAARFSRRQGAGALAAAAFIVVVACLFAWRQGYWPGIYATSTGAMRVVLLQDHSQIALDTNTRIRVHFSNTARLVDLIRGQAQFSVAKDPSRPFKVQAGDRTIVAVGTVFNVEYVDQEMKVAMLEGKVAVLREARDESSREPGAFPSGSILTAGEALHVRSDGRANLIPKADLDALSAWRHGEIVFHDEPLADAVRRMNRYSRLQIKIDDPALARLRFSGVFEAGDSRAFVDAIQSYLPVDARYTASSTVELRMKS